MGTRSRIEYGIIFASDADGTKRRSVLMALVDQHLSSEGSAPSPGAPHRAQFALASRIEEPLPLKRSNRPWIPAETHTFTSGPCTLLNFCCPTSSWVRKVVRPAPTYGETANCEFT